MEEVLLLVADDDGDVRDPGGVQLLDLPLDEDLPAHAQHALGTLVGDGGEALGQAGGHDDRVVDPIGFQSLDAGRCDAPIGDVPGRLAGAHGGVDAAQGHPGRFLDLSLRQRGVRPVEGVQDVELRL